MTVDEKRSSRSGAQSVLGILYMLTFPNGKSYIGITRRTAEARFCEHVAFASSGRRKFAVHSAIQKFGAESVTVKSLASANWQYLKELEVRAIAAFGTLAPSGYNLTQGGEGVVGFTDETRAKMGAANKGRKPSAETLAKLSAASAGRSHSPEARAKISSARTGMKFSEEHRRRLSEARQAVVASGRDILTPEGRARISAASASKVGVPRSAETRAKLSAAGVGKKMPAEVKAKISAAMKGRPRPHGAAAKGAATRAANRIAKIHSKKSQQAPNGAFFTPS